MYCNISLIEYSTSFFYCGKTSPPPPPYFILISCRHSAKTSMICFGFLQYIVSLIKCKEMRQRSHRVRFDLDGDQTQPNPTNSI